MFDQVAADLATLASRRVFFAHQSVGSNILDGVRDLLGESRRALPIVEWPAERGPAVDAGILWHAKVGRNEEPLTKIADFARLLDGGLAGQVDIALLKFCYIDINPTTDVAGLCDRYRAALDDLQARHPSVAIMAVTAPLRHAEGGFGVQVRELLGRPNRAKAANLARHQFNQRLRQAWAGRPFFDLAAAESTRPDGQRETVTYSGDTAENLVAEYTDDGGHLNSAGHKTVAAAFLAALARATAPSR